MYSFLSYPNHELGFWLPAARCLVCLARLDSGPLVALLRQLLADCDAEGADLLQASTRTQNPKPKTRNTLNPKP